MPVAELLQEHRQLCHSLRDLHVRQIALEEDGALRPQRAFVVEGIGGVDDFIAGFLDCGILLLGHR